MNLGNLYKSKTDYENCEIFLIKSLTILEQIHSPLHPSRAVLYLNLGKLYKKREDHNNCEIFYLKALTVLENMLPDDSLELASLYVKLGKLYSKKDDPDKSLNFYSKALEIRTSVLNSTHPDLTSLYLLLGQFYCVALNFADSDHFLSKAIQIQVEVPPKKHPDFAKFYTTVADIYQKWIDSNLAPYSVSNKLQLLYEKAVEAFQAVSPSDKIELAKLYKKLGNVCTTITFALSKSMEYKLKALNLFEENLPLDHPDIFTMYVTIKIKCGYGRQKQIEELYLKALEL